jgi:hypothetical protein
LSDRSTRNIASPLAADSDAGNVQAVIGTKRARGNHQWGRDRGNGAGYKLTAVDLNE